LADLCFKVQIIRDEVAALKVQKGRRSRDEFKSEWNKTPWKKALLMRSGSLQKIDEVEEFGKQVRHWTKTKLFFDLPLHFVGSIFSHLCRLVCPSL
jgi:hypothetical protein